MKLVYLGTISLAAAMAACGSGSGIEPDRQTDGIGASSNVGAGGPSINGGAGTPSINGGAGGSSINGGAGTPVIEGPGSSGSGGSGGGCGADSPTCKTLEAAFAGDGADAFDCSNTGYPAWAVGHYVTPDGSGQCALRDGYIAEALSSCWAFHCTTSAANCSTYAGDVGTQICNAQQICGGGTLGNDVCTTDAHLPCSELSTLSCSP